jgi:hypothetical protein
MEVEQLRRLRDLNIELLRVIIHALHLIDKYRKEHHMPLLTDPKIEYRIQQAIDLINEINMTALPPNHKHPNRTPEDSTVCKIVNSCLFVYNSHQDSQTFINHC